MDYERWKRFYKSIINEFGYSEEKDIESARILDEILREKDVDGNLKRLKDLIHGKDVVVFGAGPSLSRSLGKYRDMIRGLVKIAADGATTALLERDIVPDVVVTDLDGRIEDIIKSDRMGSIIVLHAHGDNIDMIIRYGRDLENIIGTTQTDPSRFKNLLNFGGFTDGDRAVFLAEHLDASKIYLVGFDFDGKIGFYSFTKNVDVKRKKLRWCKKLLDEIGDLVFLT